VGLIGNGIEHNGDMLKNDIEHVIKGGIEMFIFGVFHILKPQYL
jgi:hypothetical protein